MPTLTFSCRLRLSLGSAGNFINARPGLVLLNCVITWRLFGEYWLRAHCWTHHSNDCHFQWTFQGTLTHLVSFGSVTPLLSCPSDQPAPSSAATCLPSVTRFALLTLNRLLVFLDKVAVYSTAIYTRVESFPDLMDQRAIDFFTESTTFLFCVLTFAILLYRSQCTYPHY